MYSPDDIQLTVIFMSEKNYLVPWRTYIRSTGAMGTGRQRKYWRVVPLALVRGFWQPAGLSFPAGVARAVFLSSDGARYTPRQSAGELTGPDENRACARKRPTVLYSC